MMANVGCLQVISETYHSCYTRVIHIDSKRVLFIALNPDVLCPNQDTTSGTTFHSSGAGRGFRSIPIVTFY